MFIILALITALLGVVPLVAARKFVASAVTGVLAFLLLWFIYYLATPSLVWPLYGAIGIFVIVFWFVSACVEGGMTDDFPKIGGSFFAVGLVILIISGMAGCGAFRYSDYKSLIGDVGKREWTNDVQPKDPRHVRLVPKELAFYLATKQFGEVGGAIGSQFHVSEEEMTLQLINGELWYVAPLEYSGYSVWTTQGYTPGYVMVHGEDPKRQVIVKTGDKFRYMPSAYFGDNLERHLWHKYYDKGLTDYSFEIDEQGKTFWVVTMFEPTIAWSGKKVTGVLIVDPTTGDDTFYPLGKVPDWVDRVVPESFVENYIDWYGEYVSDWWNSWWGQKDVFEAENPSIIYGSDGNPYWVTDITSKSDKDKSLIGLVYTNSRTGKSVIYHAIGGTDSAVLQLVNNKVSYQKLHGSSPVIYNIYGVMTSIVPLLGESHTFMGVAFVDVANLQLAIGSDQLTAFREYQKLITTAGQQLAPEKTQDFEQIKVTIDRFAAEVRGSETVYYLHASGYQHVFTASGDISPKLPLTKEGDEVTIGFLKSDEDVVPISSFDNENIPLLTSKTQKEVRAKVAERTQQVLEEKQVKDARGQLQNMSDKEVRELLKLKEQSAGKKE